jgi:hypothetical protein
MIFSTLNGQFSSERDIRKWKVGKGEETSKED